MARPLRLRGTARLDAVMNKRVDENQNLSEDTIMKRAKQILWLLPFYLLSLSVSPASASQITLSTSTGYTGDSVTVTGTGFFANTSVNVWFDQNFDAQPTYPGTGAPAYLFQCGTSGNRPCEPFVPVTTDSSGNFVTNLVIPPGRNADFLGAGTYCICVDAVQGGGAEASAAFKVPAGFTLTRSSYNGMSLVWFSGSNFVPFHLDDGAQSNGTVWIDANGDFKYRYRNAQQQWVDEGEPEVVVYVLSDGMLSRCRDSYCGNSYVVDTTHGSLYGVNVRADINLMGDGNRSVVQNVEASTFLPGLCSARLSIIPCLK